MYKHVCIDKGNACMLMAMCMQAAMGAYTSSTTAY